MVLGALGKVKFNRSMWRIVMMRLFMNCLSYLISIFILSAALVNYIVNGAITCCSNERAKFVHRSVDDV